MLEVMKPTFLLVGNPQMSKDGTLQTSDLFSLRAFGKVIDRFDQALGLPARGSLQFERQIASVAWSVAVHTAFVEGLSERLHPGLLDPRNRSFGLMFTGHSVGEMAALIEAGVCGIPTMAWMLNEREKITNNRVEAGIREMQQSSAAVVRRMFAIVGIDPKQVEEQLGHMTGRFTEPAKIFLANYNTPRQAVVGLEVSAKEAEGLEREEKTLGSSLHEALSGIIDPATLKPMFGRFRVTDLGLSNAFHTAIMQYEGMLYQRVITSKLIPENFRLPQERSVYSPTLPGWLSSLDFDPTFNVIQHILTNPVQFTGAMEEFKAVPNLVGMITADKKEVTGKMIKQNDVKIPVSNIVDVESLEAAIDTAVVQIQQA